MGLLLAQLGHVAMSDLSLLCAQKRTMLDIPDLRAVMEQRAGLHCKLGAVVRARRSRFAGGQGREFGE